jgi:SAM-dependent methyltransferase
MNLSQTSQYDTFAMDYHWLYSDVVLSGEPFVAENRGILDRLSPDAEVLDCSCGIGVHALALARHGVSVRGADASPEMVKQARERAILEQADVCFTTASWRDLPAAYGREFDLVFCCGNSIGHCRNEGEMLASLEGMRGVMKDDGLLVLNSRNWEKLRTDRPRFQTMGIRIRNGIRCIPLYVWSFPSTWEKDHVIEVVLLFDDDGRVSHRSYRISYFPFLQSQLIERLQRVGFCNIESDYTDASDVYTIRARRGRQPDRTRLL